MLGIFLIISLIVYWLIKWQSYNLLKEDYTEPVELDSNGRTYEACYGAAVLNVVSGLLIALGYISCAWPYLFIEGVDRDVRFIAIVAFGFIPLSLIAYACYLDFRKRNGHIRISSEEIEYKGHKSFFVSIGDIKNITCFGLYSYKLHLEEKDKLPLWLNLSGFYKRKEADSLLKQLRDYFGELSDPAKTHAQKFTLARFEEILGKYRPIFYAITISLLLFYGSYCCIDYDFFRKDYLAAFNALYAEPNQTENAWAYYVQTVVSYSELDETFQSVIDDNLKVGQLDLTDEQKANLKQWFDWNESSWVNLKKATSINYCNITCENLSLVNKMDPDDLSKLPGNGYFQIRYLYSNMEACHLAGVVDLEWLDLLQMQLATSTHFINGKTFIDQLAGYGMLGKSIKLLAKQDNYEFEDLEKVRILLRKHFCSGLPSLRLDGEILRCCGLYDDVLSIKRIPAQTPFNPAFYQGGSATAMETHVRKQCKALIEQIQKGVEIKPRGFSIMPFSKIRKEILRIINDNLDRVYKISRRAEANLLAAYFLLDLEEYKLMKGFYPLEVSHLVEAGLTSELPDDPDSGDKIIYRNDGQRAILYAVGENAKDDGGYKDEKDADPKRDDIIYWERNMKGGKVKQRGDSNQLLPI